MRYPAHLSKLIATLRRLPGVGVKSAERFAFHLLTLPKEHLEEIGNVIRTTPEHLHHCLECGCLMERSCDFCRSNRQTTRALCVISSPREAYAIESTGEFLGLYHVLGGVLSPLEGINPSSLTISKLKERIQTHQITEVVIALDATLEGDATALYLKNELEPLGTQTTRLAFGLPMGSSLDYIDGGTLARAFLGRNRF